MLWSQKYKLRTPQLKKISPEVLKSLFTFSNTCALAHVQTILTSQHHAHRRTKTCTSTLNALFISHMGIVTKEISESKVSSQTLATYCIIAVPWRFWGIYIFEKSRTRELFECTYVWLAFVTHLEHFFYKMYSWEHRCCWGFWLRPECAKWIVEQAERSLPTSTSEATSPASVFPTGS